MPMTKGTLYYFGTLPPYRGGIAQHGSVVVGALRDHGYDVVTVSWESQYPAFLYKGYLPSANEKMMEDARTRFVARWWNPLDWWEIGRLARFSQGLIQPWTTPFHALSVVVSAVAARPTPTVLIVHNVETHEWFPLRNLLTRMAVRSVAAVLAHSDEVASHVYQLQPSTKVVRAAMPQLINVEGSALPPQDQLKLLMAGFVRPYKGLEVALDAVQLLKETGMELKLSVVGEFWKPSLATAETMVRERGLEKIVDLTDRYVSNSDLLAMLASHHLVVLPYLTATQSAIVPLAHAANRPVIASNLEGLAGQIEDGVDGVLFETGSAGAAAEAIEFAFGRLEALYQGTLDRSSGVDELIKSLLPLFGAATEST
jgi:glycosyltransferase involved in cell wall biosynthesis